VTFWVLMPSRGRPKSVARAVRMYALTCTAGTRLHFGFDEDDPALDLNIDAAQGHPYEVGKRDGLAGWTNTLAALHPDATELGSFGDDHVPVTQGWDSLLLASIPGGCGFAYPNDQRRLDIPESVVVSAPIVAALGWFALPAVKHWCIDNVWGDLGRGAGRLEFCRDIIVRHLHPNAAPRESAHDQTYADAADDWDADMQAYQKWRLHQMRADIKTVKEVCGAQ
jgi:hypothetical protein